MDNNKLKQKIIVIMIPLMEVLLPPTPPSLSCLSEASPGVETNNSVNREGGREGGRKERRVKATADDAPPTHG